MKVSVVLLWIFLSCAEPQRGEEQLLEKDVQSSLNQIQNQSQEERPELITDQPTSKPDVWTELRELRDMVVEQKVELQQSQTQIMKLMKEKSELEGRMVLADLEIKVLKEEKTNTPKVAFSFGTGMSGAHGPFSKDTILVLNREITNIGNAFSPITGVFTAPIRGAYYFRYTMFGNSGTHWANVRLFRNQQSIVVAAKFPKGDHDYAASGATLLLEKGDLVYLKLAANCQIFDNGDNHFSFSGFLLFPM